MKHSCGIFQLCDERFQRSQIELKHTVELLHEEQERIIKIEAIKKSLEIEVKNLSVRLEEVEANAIVGGKRIISKLEARVMNFLALVCCKDDEITDFPNVFHVPSYRLF